MSEIEPVALVGTCKVCKFWGYSYEQYDDQQKRPCAMMDFDEVVEVEGRRDWTQVNTPSNFACNQWEAK